MAHPIPRLREVFDFIGLDFEASLASVSLNSVHSGRWKADISEKDLSTVQTCLKRPIEVYYYNISGDTDSLGCSSSTARG